MNYETIESELKELDSTIKPFYRRLNQAHDAMYMQAKSSEQMNASFMKAVRLYLVNAYNIAQIEQYRLAYEMVMRMYELQRVDPQIIQAFKKGSREYAMDEVNVRRIMSTDFSIRRWCMKEYARLKKL
jgi:hypothetical protein